MTGDTSYIDLYSVIYASLVDRFGSKKLRPDMYDDIQEEISKAVAGLEDEGYIIPEPEIEVTEDGIVNVSIPLPPVLKKIGRLDGVYVNMDCKL